MRQLFTSATMQLTGWYLAILACISLLFSIIVYQVSTGEVERRLVRYQDRSWSILQTVPNTSPLETVRTSELAESKAAIVGILVYVNIAVLGAGGYLSYLLAKRTLRPIEEAHENQARFVSDASHELRTPLATMTTELEVVLQDPTSTKQELRETLSSSLEEVQRLTKLSTTLLALSSGNAKHLPQQPFDLQDALQAVADRFRKIHPTIRIKMGKSTNLVIGHQASIEELLSILLDNAVKYSTPKKPITLSTRKHRGRVELTVINHGPGISPVDLPHIFDRFYRADTSRTGSSGYGLGLALAQQIASVHKTVLAAQSTPGKTTSFSFSLQAPQSRS